MLKLDKTKFKFEYSWLLPITVELFDCKQQVNVSVDGENHIADFEDEQTIILNYLETNLNHILKAAESAIFDHYQTVVCKGGMSNVVPEISKVSEIVAFVKLNTIVVPYNFDSKILEFGLSLDCSWDTSHGLGLLYNNFKLVEIGGFDIING